MKRVLIFSLLTISVIFSACQKVIDVDLNSADPKLVIEFLLGDSMAPYTLKLTRTVDYFDGGVVPQVSGAVITLTDDLGNSEQLTEVQPGRYITGFTQAVAGRTYFLNVTVDGETYSATSRTPSEVPLDTIYGEYVPPFFGNVAGYVTTAGFTDPAAEVNYYRQRVYINGELQDTAGIFYLVDDRLSNGRYLQFPLFPIFAELNDTVEVEMWSIDKPAYDYYTTLEDIATDGGAASASPGNPVTMMSGGALGYFITGSVSRARYVVQ
ncbi:MAG: DUF4249 domain-containing protein [Bacteroidia bacterium]|jgi:hypothetical protein|nr:DUF4249 domain-containing protein [Bacteroidia bacterium]